MCLRPCRRSRALERKGCRNSNRRNDPMACAFRSPSRHIRRAACPNRPARWWARQRPRHVPEQGEGTDTWNARHGIPVRPDGRGSFQTGCTSARVDSALSMRCGIPCPKGWEHRTSTVGKRLGRARRLSRPPGSASNAKATKSGSRAVRLLAQASCLSSSERSS